MIPIKGLQKTTLVDYPNTLACTVFLGGCNLRCGYCYNVELAISPHKLPSIPEEDFFSFLKSRKGFLEGVCITGGEPTLWSDLPAFCKRIKQEGFLVKLDTNGTNPKMLKELISRKLVDYVAMDVKAPLEKYAAVTGVSSVAENIRQSVSLLVNSAKDDATDYEFRTTLIPDVIDESALSAILTLISGAKRYFLQQFKSVESTIGERYQTMEPLPESTVRRFLDIAVRSIEQSEIRSLE